MICLQDDVDDGHFALKHLEDGPISNKYTTGVVVTARGSVHWEQFRAIVHFDVLDDIGDGLLRHRMKSGSESDDGFVTRNPKVP